MDEPTDDEIAAWADNFIRQNAYNRAVAVQIAVEAAKWVRGQRALSRLSELEKAEPDAWRVKKDYWVYFESRPDWYKINGFEVQSLYTHPAAAPQVPKDEQESPLQAISRGEKARLESSLQQARAMLSAAPKAERSDGDGVPPTAQYEARRWCKGDGEWTNWQPVPPDALARRLADSTFEVRATDGVGPSSGSAPE